MGKEVYIIFESCFDDIYAPHESVVCVVKTEELAKSICQKANEKISNDLDHFSTEYTYKKYKFLED